MPVDGSDDRLACRYISISRDITGRKLAEEKLRLVQEELEALVRLGPGTLYRLAIGRNGERRLSIPSTGIFQQMGYTAHETAGSCFMLHVHPPDLPALFDATERCMKAGQAISETGS